MAENIPIKPHKSTTEKVKLSNVASRTTSETLRIGETDSNSIPVVQLPPQVITNSRKKPCSFQITSVIVGRSNDGGDDSADDLDDISHADDISDMVDASRITDNETPSLSEDTISKEDIYYNVSGPMSLCSAPVIPTSSQYGLVIVSPGNGADATGTTASTCGSTTAPISSIPFTVQAGRPPEHIIIHTEQCANKSSTSTEHDHVVGKEGSQPVRADRFKVVKIESTEPFKRGRWTCMDFLDSANTPFGGAPSQTGSTTVNASPNAHPQAAQSLPQIPQGVVGQSNQSQVPYYPTHQQQAGMSQQFQPVQQSAPSSMPQQYAGQIPNNIMQTTASYSVQQQPVQQQNVIPQQDQQPRTQTQQAQQPQAQSQTGVPQVPVTISSSVQQPMYNNSNRFSTYTAQPPKTSNANSAQSQYVTPVMNNSQNYVATSMGNQPTYMPQGQTYSGQLTQAIAGNIPPAQQGQTYAGHATVTQSNQYQLPKTSYQSAQYPQQTQSTVSTAGGQQQFQYVNQPVYGQPATYSVNIPSSPVSVPQQAPSYPAGIPPTTQTAGDIQQQQTYVPTTEQFQPGIATFSMAQPQQPQSVSTYVQPTAVPPEEPTIPVESRDIAAVTEDGQPNAPLPDEADT